MEFVRVIFSSFWAWLGFIILVSVIGGGVIELVKACKPNRKIKAYRIGNRWYFEAENVTRAEVEDAVTSAAHETCEEKKPEVDGQ